MLFTPGVQGTWDLSPLDTGQKFAHPWIQGLENAHPFVYREQEYVQPWCQGGWRFFISIVQWA